MPFKVTLNASGPIGHRYNDEYTASTQSERRTGLGIAHWLDIPSIASIAFLVFIYPIRLKDWSC